MKFALYTADGAIVALGECPDGMEAEQARIRPGTAVWIGAAEMHDRIDVATRTLIKGEPPALTYRQKRRYPPIAEQLDALWRAMDAGEIPMAKEFHQMIKETKEAHPDPEALKKVVL